MQVESAPKRQIGYAVAIIVLMIIGGFTVGYTLNLQNQVQDLTSKVNSLTVETKSLQTVVNNMQKTLVDVQNRLSSNGAISPLPEGERLSNGLDFSELYQRVKESIVQIQAGSATGSGWVYDDNNHIVTNFHVVESTNNVNVILHDGTIFVGKVVGKDQYSDLAVILVNTTQGIKLKPLPLGDSMKLRVGERVVAVGAPFGLSGSISQGIVSQIGRLLPAPGTQYSIPNMIQIDASINPGSSGGALLNLNGEVVGVTSAGISDNGGFQGVGLAIPSSIVKRVIPSLLATGTYKHPFLGITGGDLLPVIVEANRLNVTRGVIVVDVLQGSPAERAGLRRSVMTQQRIGNDIVSIPVGGDVIIGVDGNIVRKIDDLIAYSEEFKKPGDSILLTILREGRKITINVVLGERPLPNN